MIRAVIFDMDGTLVDTEMAAANSVSASFKQWGIDVDPNDARFIVGRTWEKAFDFLFGKYAVPIARAEAEKQLLSQYRHSMQNTLVEVPGARTAVAALATHYKLALVSGSHRQEILFILDSLGIRHHFAVILGAEDYPRSKPAPDGFLKALELLKVNAEETLVFEDSEAGIASGLAAGLKVCAITSTNHFAADQSQSHHQIADLSMVTAEWLRELKFSA